MTSLSNLKAGDAAAMPDAGIIFNWQPPPLGVHQVDERTYQEWQAVRHSYLKLLETHAPATVAQWMLAPSKKTAAFELGSAWHCAVLEPDSFDDVYRHTNISARTNRFKEMKAEHEADGSILLSIVDYQLVLAMRDALYNNLINAEPKAWLEAPGQNELSVVSEFETTPGGPVVAKCRIDRYQEHPQHGGMVIVDLKTTSGSASAEGFTESGNQWGYVSQLPFYEDALKFHGLPVTARYFLVQEKTKPYAAAVHKQGNYSTAVGRIKYQRWLDTWAYCLLKKEFPGHTSLGDPLELR